MSETAPTFVSSQNLAAMPSDFDRNPLIADTIWATNRLLPSRWALRGSGIEGASVHDDLSKLQAYLHLESSHDYPYVLTTTCGGTVVHNGTENMCVRAQ